jgi:hypothetical protein
MTYFEKTWEGSRSRGEEILGEKSLRQPEENPSMIKKMPITP